MEHSMPDGQLPSSDTLSALEQGFAQRRVSLGLGETAVTCRQGGQRGPVIVLLHGISSGAPSWLPCASLLAGHARVVAWDAPGYGGSTPLAQAAPRAADYGAALEALLRALDVRPDVIVGHSLGALMAAAYVANAASDWLPSRLLLISPAQGYGGPGNEARAQTVAAERLEALDRLGVAGLAQRGPARLLSAAADAGAQAWVRWNMARLQPPGYRQAVALLTGDSIDGYLARRPPGLDVRVACGAQDVVTPPAGCAALAERFRLPFSVIRDAGHACYIEQGAEVARWIRAA